MLSILGVSLFFDYKGFLWLCFLVCSVMGVFFSFSYGNPDYLAYYSFFNEVSFDHFVFINGDPSSYLFSWLNVVLKEIGCDFNAFRLIVFVMIALLFFCFFYKKIEIGLFLLIYGVVPFIYDLVQIRLFIAEALVLFAMNFLLKKNYFLFVLFYIVAIYFHSMVSVCFLIFFVPRNFILSRKARKMLLFVSCVLVCVCFIGNPIIDIVKTFVSSLPSFNEYHRYFETSDVKLGFLLYAFYQMLNVLVAYYLNIQVTKKTFLPVWNMRLNTLNFNVQIVGILFVVLTMININFARFFRMFLMLNVLNFSSLLYLEKKVLTLNNVYCEKYLCLNSRNKTLNFVGVSLLIVCWIMGESLVNHSYVTILQSLKFGF